MAEHALILVTGLHRSGTKIAAKMIAEDTGHDLVLEQEFYDGCVEAFEAFLDADYGPKVVQCPFMLCRIHYYPEALVVFVRRDTDDIVRSFCSMRSDGDRIFNHAWIAAEMRAYHTEADTAQELFELKLENWRLQQQRLIDCVEVDYEDLSGHPLWVPADRRRRADLRDIEHVG